MENHERPRLVVQEGPNEGETYVLEEMLNTIGRTPDNQVVVDSGRISRQHVQIKVLPAGAIIEDLGSTNGTWINGQRLTDARRLNSGDTIQLADYISFRYVMLDPNKTEKLAPREAEIATQALRDYTPPPPAQPASASYPASDAAGYTPPPAAVTLDEEAAPATRSTWTYVGIGALVLLILICLAVAIYLWFAPVEFWYWLFDLVGAQYP